MAYFVATRTGLHFATPACRIDPRLCAWMAVEARVVFELALVAIAPAPLSGARWNTENQSASGWVQAYQSCPAVKRDT